MLTSPHLVEIRIIRKEPGSTFNSKAAARILAEQFSVLAERIIAKGILKKPACPKNRKRAEDKIMDLVETDERLKTVKFFLESWNKWRDFYFDLPALEIKTKSQLTSVENAIAFINEHGLNMQLMIAAVHRAHRHRKFRPNFNTITHLGIECYDEHYDYVMADIDERNYVERASRA